MRAGRPWMAPRAGFEAIVSSWAVLSCASLQYAIPRSIPHRQMCCGFEQVRATLLQFFAWKSLG